VLKMHCDRCKIAHYKWMAIYVPDQLTLDGIVVLLKGMLKEKATFHPAIGT
jgi:hypothetical protein